MLSQANAAKSAQSGSDATWWATISTQARETVWWYFCGARAYAAMCWIQSQILADRLRHAVPPHGQEGQVDVLPVPEISGLPPVISGQMAASPVPVQPFLGCGLVLILPSGVASADLLQGGDDGVIASHLGRVQPGERLSLEVGDGGEGPGGYLAAQLGERQPERAAVRGIHLPYPGSRGSPAGRGARSACWPGCRSAR